MPTVKFYTLGCKVNQYDTQAMREQLLSNGCREAAGGHPAQLYVINTCTVTGRTDAESLMLIRKAHRENPRARIVVTGCFAERDENRIKAQNGVSLILKNAQKADMYRRITGGINPEEDDDSHTQDSLFCGRGISYFEGRTRAFLKIQDGCDNRCSYCKVRLARGPSRSRPPDEIIAEARRLADNGFREIVLCGICLGAYGGDLPSRRDLAGVIEALDSLKEITRIRLSSIEAHDVSLRLIRSIAASRAVCRHLHIPLQSGDDTVLGKMNRRYRRRDYVNLIRRLRRHIPDIAVTTDILVGFPGETDEQFERTVTLVSDIQPPRAHIFPYSRRPGTAAGAMVEDEVSGAVVQERCRRLRAAVLECSAAYTKRFIRRVCDVLFEEKASQRPGFWQGYTDTYIKVRVRSRRNLKNAMYPVMLQEIDGDAVVGTLNIC